MPDWDRWDIAGYGSDRFWVDVENGDADPVPWEDVEERLEGADQMVVSFLDSEGEPHYYTVDILYADYEAIADDLDDLESEYGLG